VPGVRCSEAGTRLSRYAQHGRPRPVEDNQVFTGGDANRKAAVPMTRIHTFTNFIISRVASLNPDLFPKSLKERRIPEPKTVHSLFLFIAQLPWSAGFDSKHIPSGSVGHCTIGGFDERAVLMHTTAMTPAFRPRGFVMEVEGPIANTQ
jgi:hypothetical protein